MRSPRRTRPRPRGQLVGGGELLPGRGEVWSSDGDPGGAQRSARTAASAARIRPPLVGIFGCAGMLVKTGTPAARAQYAADVSRCGVTVVAPPRRPVHPGCQPALSTAPTTQRGRRCRGSGPGLRSLRPGWWQGPTKRQAAPARLTASMSSSGCFAIETIPNATTSGSPPAPAKCLGRTGGQAAGNTWMTGGRHRGANRATATAGPHSEFDQNALTPLDEGHTSPTVRAIRSRLERPARRAAPSGARPG